MIDVNSINRGLRISSSILLIASFLNTKNSKSLSRGTWVSLISVILGILSSSSELYLYLWPALAAGLMAGLISAYFVSLRSLPAFLALGFSLISLFLSYSFVAVFEGSSDLSLFQQVLFTTGNFLASLSFTGSIITLAKFTSVLHSKQLFIFSWFRHVLNLLLFASIVAFLVLFSLDLVAESVFLYSVLGLSYFFGFHTHLAVGFCDMSLMLPLMTSYMGFALTALGMMTRDYLLIIAGSLLGSSGLVLGFHLAKVIYRNLISVMLASFSQSEAEEVTYFSSKSNETVSNQELIKLIKISSNILIVPGYGVVKSNCEKKIVELLDILKNTTKNVKICLHPAAGRIPGQLNLVFEEAGLDPNLIVSLEESNSKMKETDLVITVGANDIINSGSLDHSNSALGGFPVLKIWESKSAVVMLPSPNSLGFCKQNLTLSEKPKVKFMFGDANILLLALLREAKSRKHSLIKYNPADPISEVSGTTEFMEFPKSFSTIGVPKETEALEKRVALTPSMVNKFRMLGFRVQIEKNAGKAADFLDEDYQINGAEVVDNEDVWDNDIILKIQKPNQAETELLSRVKVLISYVYPSKCTKYLDQLSKKFPKLTYIAMDLVPKSNKGQSVDSVKLMQAVEGYRAVIEAFRHFQRCPKPMITAAGKLPPAQVLVVGTDKGGLSAVSYCKNLGCLTRAIDTKNLHSEEIEQLHAQLLIPKPAAEGEDPLKYFRELLFSALKKSDIVVCAGLLHHYEKIIDENILSEMNPGSVLVDIYGNLCSKSVKDKEIVTQSGVTVLYYSDLASRMAPQSSELYANCLYNIFLDICNSEEVVIDELDDLVGSMLVVKEGRMLWYNRAPPSPITAMVNTGKIAFRLSLPAQQDNEESIWSKLDFLWTGIFLLAVVVGFSFVCLGFDDWVLIMEDLLVLVLALIIGWFIFSNTLIKFYTNLVARAAGVTGMVLVAGFRFWHELDEFGIVLAALLTFAVSMNFSFLFGIGLRTCRENQVKLDSSN